MTAPDVPTSAVDGPEVAVAAVLADALTANLAAALDWDWDGGQENIPTVEDVVAGVVADLTPPVAAALAPLFAAERDRAVAAFAADVERRSVEAGVYIECEPDPYLTGLSDGGQAILKILRTAAAERGAAQPSCGLNDVGVTIHDADCSCPDQRGGSRRGAAQPTSNAADVERDLWWGYMCPALANIGVLKQAQSDLIALGADWAEAGRILSRVQSFYVDAAHGAAQRYLADTAALAQSPVPLTDAPEAVAGDE